MELRTFGAVLSFALAGEEASLVRVNELLADGGCDPIRADLERLLQMKTRHLKNLERLRREQVVEMILEAIVGLESTDFPDPPYPNDSGPGEALRWLLSREKRAASFLALAAEKIRQKEVSRIFVRIGREKGGL